MKEIKATPLRKVVLDPNDPEQRKMLIEMAVDRVVEEYGETLKKLAQDDTDDMSWKEWRDELL